MPYAADFNNKYGTCLLALGRTAEAKTVLQKVLQEVPNHVSANTNIGFMYMQEGNNTMAYDYMMKANALDPDYEQNLLNLAVWHYTAGQPDKARLRLEHLLRKHPQNERARAMLLDLDSK
jgi:Tfp pilus assembly protein PilF